MRNMIFMTMCTYFNFCKQVDDFKNNEALFAVRGILAIVQNIYRWDTWKVKLEFKLVEEISYNSKESFAVSRFILPDGKENEEEL